VQKKIDLIAANWVGGEHGGFDTDDNALHVFWAQGEQHLPLTDKKHLAQQLLVLIRERMDEKNTAKNSG
jgi:phosphopantothenoylcysteine decarboxylase/phosphopantothenate--cysteine ligase